MDAQDLAQAKPAKLDKAVQKGSEAFAKVRTQTMPPVGWQDVFFKALSIHGRPTHAAKEAGVSDVRVYALRRQKPRFAKRWVNAVNRAKKSRIDRLEAEIERRGVDGWDEPVFQNGEVVGYKRRFDSRLLLAQAQAEHPKKWGKRQESTAQVNVLVTHATQARLLDDPAVAQLACDLAAKLAAPQKALAQTPEIEV